MKVMETERLILRYLTEDDADFFMRLANTPAWLKYIGDRNIHNIEASAKYMRDGSIKSYKEKGFGFYMVELKETGEPLGVSGLIKRETLDDVDIGFAFMPEAEGKGYGFESANAVMDFARNNLKLKRIIAITDQENKRSIKLLEKLGLVYEQMVIPFEDGKELMLFGTNF